MNANITKNNSKLLMATVVVIAMLACCFVVAMPGASAAYDASEGTYADVEGVTFNPDSSDLQVSFIDENGDEYPWSTGTPVCPDPYHAARHIWLPHSYMHRH